MISPPPLSVPSSIAPDANVMNGAVDILAQVETLPLDATGALTFGQEGVVLVENGKLCWAMAKGMKGRLSKLLRQQRSPPLELSYLEQALHECQATGKPLTDALLASGEISEEGLHTALFSHIAEAVARIAQSDATCDGFMPSTTSYDARFMFSTADVFSALGASSNRALAVAARRGLQATLIPDTRGMAFLRDDVGPVAVAVEGRPSLKVPEIVDLCGWSCSLFDVAATFDKGVRVVTGSSGESDAVVAWRRAETHFVAVCANRAAAALLVARLESVFDPPTEVGP